MKTRDAEPVGLVQGVVFIVMGVATQISGSEIWRRIERDTLNSTPI